jgi:hypothetical protein
LFEPIRLVFEPRRGATQLQLAELLKCVRQALGRRPISFSQYERCREKTSPRHSQWTWTPAGNLRCLSPDARSPATMISRQAHSKVTRAVQLVHRPPTTPQNTSAAITTIIPTEIISVTTISIVRVVHLSFPRLMCASKLTTTLRPAAGPPEAPNHLDELRFTGELLRGKRRIRRRPCVFSLQ